MAEGVAVNRSAKERFPQLGCTVSQLQLVIALGLTLLLVCPTNVAAQQGKMAEELQAALAIHDAAKTTAEEIRALNEFRVLADRYPKQWQPTFWASYLATQVARLQSRVDDFPEDLDRRELIRDAVRFAEETIRRGGEVSAELASDFQVLDGFASQFYRNMVATTDQQRGKWHLRRAAAYESALGLNPRNPLMAVFTAINYFGEDNDVYDAAAGLVLLDYAEAIYDGAPNRAMTTYFNSDFIGFWRSRGEARLHQLLAEGAEEDG